MKPEIIVMVLVMTDSTGEWWEVMGNNGAAERFIPGTSEYSPAKLFKNTEAAVTYTRNKGYNTFIVLSRTPPKPPNITWDQKIIYDTRVLKNPVAETN